MISTGSVVGPPHCSGHEVLASGSACSDAVWTRQGHLSLFGLKGNLSLALMVLVKWEHVPSVVLLNQEVLVYGFLF